MTGARTPPRIRLWVVLAAAFLTLLVGFLHKSWCLGPDFRERSSQVACYTDLIPLYKAEALSEGRVPYIEATNEYPVGIGLLMWIASLPATSPTSFFLWNSLLLAALALLTTVVLYRIVGPRACFFALAPTLALSAFLNWDLLPVALTTLAVAAYLQHRDGMAGAFLGLGAAAKVFPGFLFPPFAWGRIHAGGRRTLSLVAWAAGAWLVLNLPFALISFRDWSWSYRYSAERPVSFATLWFIGCRSVGLFCGNVPLVNVASLVLFCAGVVLVWRFKSRKEPGFPAWTFGFPILVVFLLTNKVYSPQYSLWLLPWFALVLPNLRLFLWFETVDLIAFITEFSWLGAGLPTWMLELTVLFRATVLCWLLFAYVQSDTRVVAPTERTKAPVRGLGRGTRRV